MLFSYSFICVAANIKMRDELSLYDAYVHNKCDFRKLGILVQNLTRRRKTINSSRAFKKQRMPQRTVIPLHYQVDDLDDLTGV